MLQPILQRQAFDPAKFAGVVGNQDAPRGQRCSALGMLSIHNFPMLFYKRYFRKPFRMLLVIFFACRKEFKIRQSIESILHTFIALSYQIC